MKIGYARVSRGDSQDIDPQLRALRDAGCDPIYQEEASGGRADRPELARAIGALEAGDVLVGPCALFGHRFTVASCRLRIWRKLERCEAVAVDLKAIGPYIVAGEIDPVPA